MKLPPGKGKPNLPPTPAGGGAAARQRQFELERGMETPASDGQTGTTPGEEDAGTKKKKKKRK